MTTLSASGPLIDLVDREVELEGSSGETRHGTITRASYSLFGEPALTIHLAVRPSEVVADMVLFGHLASELISHTQVGGAVNLEVDQAGSTGV